MAEDSETVDTLTIWDYEVELNFVIDEIPEWADMQKPRNKYEVVIRPTGELAHELAKTWGGRHSNPRTDEQAAEMVERDGTVKKTFDFWGSINEWENNEYASAIDALESVLLDAGGYWDAEGTAERKDIKPVDAYAREYYSGVTLGEDVSLTEIMETFEEVKTTATKLALIGIGEDDVHNMFEELQNYHD